MTGNDQRSAPNRATPSKDTRAQYGKRARYFHAMALSASTTDVAITLIRLAEHYERLARDDIPNSGTAGTRRASRSEMPDIVGRGP